MTFQSGLGMGSLAKAGALALALASPLSLAGCGAAPSPSRIIADRCVRDGDPASVCRCLGERSAAQLDPDFLQLVVLAAQGRVEQADEDAARLPADRAEVFAAQLARIEAECRPRA